jgi:hypothetical protein
MALAVPAKQRTRAFFDHVPALFEASKPRWEQAYNDLIYHVERPLTAANVRSIIAWTDGGRVATGPKELALLHETHAKIRWPDVRPLARLRAIEGMTLPRATALLHFHNPSFPPFTADAVRGLALVGPRVRRPEALGLEEVRAYRRYLDAIVALKEGIPFRDVPESHYFHVWLLECALAEWARRA